MKKCPSCAEEIQEAAVKCRFCGEVLSNRETSLLGEVAGAEIKLKTMILDVPTYARTFLKILKAPTKYFRHLTYTDKDSFKHGIAFMLQGIALSFVILTIGWAVPQFLASFAAMDVSLSSEYATRSQEVKSVLPPPLAKEWFKQSELILIVRTLPEDRFRRMLDRLRDLAEKEPDLLEQAIKGSLTFDDRVDSRQRILYFFYALDPEKGTLLHRTREIVSILPKYELKPHVDFLIRNILLWYFACYTISWFMQLRLNDGNKRAVFVIGAYLLGFLGPVVETFRTLGSIYLVTTLPNYVQRVSYFLMEAEATGTSTTRSFVSSDILLFLLGIILVRWAPVVIAIGVFFIGTRSAYQVSKARALTAATIGVGVGLMAMEVVGRLVVMLLAPTGLL